MADLPGGASGMLVRASKGQEADRLVTRIDPGVVSLVAELRGHERWAAEEFEQWKTVVEERKVIDASQVAVSLAMLVTPAELEQLEKGAGDGAKQALEFRTLCPRCKREQPAARLAGSHCRTGKTGRPRKA